MRTIFSVAAVVATFVITGCDNHTSNNAVSNTPAPAPEITIAPLPAVAPAPVRTIRSDTCSTMTDCQKYLASHGYPNIVADGKFGPKTNSAWLDCYSSGNCYPENMPGANSESIDCKASIFSQIGEPFINPTAPGQICMTMYRVGNDTNYLVCTGPDFERRHCLVYVNGNDSTVSQVCCPGAGGNGI